jgi:hypothetical protein
VTDNPEASYRLVQTVLIQEMALSQAQHRVAELENRVVQANRSVKRTHRRRPATSFLGDPVSRGSSAPGACAAAQRRPADCLLLRGMMSAAPSGFLRSAAATALGVVGGQMLFQGIDRCSVNTRKPPVGSIDSAGAQ